VREIVERAQAYLEDIQAATAAVHERLRAGILRLRPQPEEREDEPMPDPMAARSDPIFNTREFDLPTEIISTREAHDAIVNFDDEMNE
jgi:hypothetical protein